MPADFGGAILKSSDLDRRSVPIETDFTSSNELESACGPTSLEALDPAAMYLERLGPGSRRTMREALAKLADWASSGNCNASTLPWHQLQPDDTAALRDRLASTLAPATANKHLAALRGVLKQSARAGLMSSEAYRRAIDLPPVRGESPRKARRLTIHDLQRLVAACRIDGTPAGARDEALLVLLCTAQLRRAQAVELDLADYDASNRQLVLHPNAGSPESRMRIDDFAHGALQRWIRVRGDRPGPLMNPVNKGGRIGQRRLSKQSIYIACQKRAAEAGLPPICPEDLRRASRMAKAASRQTAVPAAQRFDSAALSTSA